MLINAVTESKIAQEMVILGDTGYQKGKKLIFSLFIYHVVLNFSLYSSFP